MWDIIKKQDYKLYKSQYIDLKLKVYEAEVVDRIYVNYKGYNLTVPMAIWEFGAECIEWSINVKMVGNDPFDKYFVVDKKDTVAFIDLIYFFMIENNVDVLLQERYKANWKE